MALGLVSSEQVSNYWSLNNRRRIFYDNPNGPAPVTGLMSLAEVDPTPFPEFKWEEKRYRGIQTTTVAGPTSGVFLYLTGSTTTAGGPATITANQIVRMYVDDASDFQIDDNIIVFGLSLTTGGPDQLQGVVREVNTAGTDYIEFKVVKAPTSTVLNTASANIGNYVIKMGSAFAEGSRSRTGRILFPYEPSNYTQIHKTAFELTRTALKEPAKYDKSGFYGDVLKTNGIDHLAGLEWNLFFGQKGKETVVDADGGSTVTRRTSGGILYFMQQYELGTDYGTTDISTQTDWRTYTGKRIIKLGGATISGADWEELQSRAFEKTYSSDYSKLWICGSGFFNRVSTYYEGKIQYTSLRDEGFDGFNFKFNKVETNGGTSYFKVHPLFNDPRMPWMRNSAFCIDLACLFWRPLTDSDTDVQRMIQLPDADKRKDQFITEGGPEIRFPEAFEYIENLGGITR